MSDEETKDAEGKEAAKESESVKTETADPYAGVEESEREKVKNYNEYLNSLGVEERARVADIAMRAHNKGMLPQIYGQEPEAPIKAEATKTEPPPEDEDETAVMKRQIAELTSKINARDQVETQQKQLEGFEKTVKTALVDAGVDAEDIAQRYEEFCGHYLTHKPMDIRASVKRFNKKQEEREVVRQKRRAEKKIADQKIKGESGGGSVPAKKAEEIGRDDLSSGKVAAEIKELMKHS